MQGFRSPEIPVEQHEPRPEQAFGSGGQNAEASPEQNRDGAREAKEVVRDGPKGDPAGVVAPPPPPLPPVLDTNLTVKPADDQSNITDTGSPSVAADADLIEKEWVDRAKELVKKTQNDPHEQEMVVSQLKADYIKKRYGRDIGMPSGG